MRCSTVTAVLAAVVLVSLAPVAAQEPPDTSDPRCEVVAGVEVGCVGDRRSSEGDGDALPWLLFGLVLLPIAVLLVAAVLAVPVLAGAGRLRRRLRRRRRPSRRSRAATRGWTG